MLRIAVVLCLLSTSTAFAGVTSGQIQVGLIITGKRAATTTDDSSATSGVPGTSSQQATVKTVSPGANRDPIRSTRRAVNMPTRKSTIRLEWH